MGPLQLSESADGTVVGKITDPKNPCGLPKGTVVLNGARLDDSVAGTLKTCKLITDTCAGFVDGDAILLITRGGGLLSGTAHFDVGACKTPMGGDAVTLKKLGGPPPPPKPKVNNRARAESLVVEAAPFIKSGEAEEARKRCEESAKLDPAYSQAFYCLGVTYYLRERYEEALEQYKLALEADPANHDVYYNIGCVFAVQGKTADALEYLKLALMNAYVDTQTLSTDADLKSLHGNPIFEKLKQGQFD
jgi:tetratricopeptide (TPR) repeat protein